MDHNDYERYHNQKVHCREGESEGYIALGWVLLGCPVIITTWFLLLWALGVIAIH